MVIIKRGKNPDPVYHLDEARIWVDPEMWFPVRVEYYTPNDPKPAVIYDYKEVHLDVPLTEKDITWEGYSPKWSLVGPPGGKNLTSLTQQDPAISDLPGLMPDGFVAMLDQALAGVKDYSTDLTLELKYYRLRQYRQDQYQFIHATNSFSALTKHIEANYMQVNNGENFRTVYDPAKDNLLHVIPAGVYKMMGEQTFPIDDPRLFSSLGDNISGLNFFAIRDELKKWLANTDQKKSGTAAYSNVKGPYLEITRKSLGIPAQPTIMRHYA